jgi:hypothetical protein
VCWAVEASFHGNQTAPPGCRVLCVRQRKNCCRVLLRATSCHSVPITLKAGEEHGCRLPCLGWATGNRRLLPAKGARRLLSASSLRGVAANGMRRPRVSCHSVRLTLKEGEEYGCRLPCLGWATGNRWVSRTAGRAFRGHPRRRQNHHRWRGCECWIGWAWRCLWAG